MSRKYPYIQDTKIKTGVCDSCSKTGVGLQFEWRVDWFQGNCEFEHICDECLKKDEKRETSIQFKKRMLDEEIERQKLYERYEKEEKEARKREKVFAYKLENEFEIIRFTPYHMRINGVLDVYSTTGKYHDLTSQERGEIPTNYDDLGENEELYKFIKSRLKRTQ